MTRTSPNPGTQHYYALFRIDSRLIYPSPQALAARRENYQS